MTRDATVRLRLYPWLVAIGVFCAFASHRPELLALSAPFAVGLVHALLVDVGPRLHVVAGVAPERTIEGGTVALTTTITSDRSTTVDVTPVLQRAVVAGPGSDGARRRVRVVPGTPTVVAWTVACPRWGAEAIGTLRIRVVEPLAAREPVHVRTSPRMTKVLPDAATVRALVAPHRTQGFGGARRARRTSAGIEFAELRTYQPGDRPRDVNWRISSRRGTPWVAARHPDESADVVLFVDSFVDVGDGAIGTLDASVRLALALTLRYLRDHDRVGLVDFGGFVRWMYPGSGLAHQYRIVDELLDTQSRTNYAWKSIALLPARALPPRALVVAISPLLDERARAAILELSRFDTVAIDVSAAVAARPKPDRYGAVAMRLWNVVRADRRAELLRAGIPVLEWRPDEAVAPVLGLLEQLHQRTRRRRA